MLVYAFVIGSQFLSLLMPLVDDAPSGTPCSLAVPQGRLLQSLYYLWFLLKPSNIRVILLYSCQKLSDSLIIFRLLFINSFSIVLYLLTYILLIDWAAWQQLLQFWHGWESPFIVCYWRQLNFLASRVGVHKLKGWGSDIRRPLPLQPLTLELIIRRHLLYLLLVGVPNRLYN